MKKTLTFLAVIMSVAPLSAQDFVRWSLGTSLDKSSTFIQSLSLDLNRTEAKSEKEGFYFLYSSKGYILPVMDFNIGDGVTSAHNNISAQVRFGKNFFLKGNYDTHLFINASPTYNADRVFDEELLYLDLDFGLNHIKSKDKLIQVNNSDLPFVYKVTSISGGVSSNLGNRWSEINDMSDSYSRTGLFLNFKMRLRKNNSASLNAKGKAYQNSDYKHWDNFIISLSSAYYSIHSELEAVTTKNSVGSLSASLDKYLNDRLSLNISYLLGDDNPKYSEIHTLIFGLKLKF